LATEKGLLASKEALKTSNSAYSDAILNTIKKECDNLTVVKDALEKSLKINNAWKQAMSKNGLRLAYIKEEVATLSALASKYASAVYEKPMQVKFYINDDKENPTLDFHVNGKNAGLFSTGEGRRLEIAMTLSLMSLLKTSGLNLGFLILDEALDGLSESSKKAVLKVIDSLASEYQILMISHDPLIKQRPGYVIQVVKDDTVSRSTVKTYIQN
jgi:DNA repair exonuclease SbcCD ATPase subunit